MDILLSDSVKYVKENKTWSDALEQVALERINQFRCDIRQACPQIADEIHDLMEEYADEHDLPEGWWYEVTDEDDIFFSL